MIFQYISDRFLSTLGQYLLIWLAFKQRYMVLSCVCVHAVNIEKENLYVENI